MRAFKPLKVESSQTPPQNSSTPTMSSSRPKIPEHTKYQILVRQAFRCKGVPDYTCPLLATTGGLFDAAGYDMDHLIPLVFGGSTDPSNLQALCVSCHRIKTAREEASRRLAPPSVDHGKQTPLRAHLLRFRREVLPFDATTPFSAFWLGFYGWSVAHRQFWKKSDVRREFESLRE